MVHEQDLMKEEQFLLQKLLRELGSNNIDHRLQQIDFHLGFGLNDTTPQRFFAAGYSFRFDHLGRWWKH